MDLPEFIDTEVLYSPAFWIIGLLVTAGFIIGFKLTRIWGGVGIEQQYSIPFYTKIILLLSSWLIAYGWVWKMRS